MAKEKIIVRKANTSIEIEADEVKGHQYSPVRFYVHKDISGKPKSWAITEASSGLAIVTGKSTRKEAVAYIKNLTIDYYKLIKVIGLQNDRISARILGNKDEVDRLTREIGKVSQEIRNELDKSEQYK